MTTAEAAVLPGTERIKGPCKGGQTFPFALFPRPPARYRVRCRWVGRNTFDAGIWLEPMDSSDRSAKAVARFV
jgi:hypothetical protein